MPSSIPDNRCFLNFFLCIQLCKGILMRAELINKLFSSLSSCIFVPVEVKLFLRLSATCFLLSVVLLLSYVIMLLQVRRLKRQRVKIFIGKDSGLCFKATTTTSWADHCWSLAKRARKKCYVDSSFRIVQLGVHCVFQLRIIIFFSFCASYPQCTFYNKTKTWLCLYLIMSQQETESSFNLGI